MNRKIGVVLLAVVALLCLSFGACNIKPGTGMTKEETLQSYIFTLDGSVVKEDFTLDRRIGDYRATWTSSSENVKLTMRDNDYLAEVTIPEKDETVTLTVDLRGATKSYTIELKAINVFDIMGSFNFAQNRGTVYEDFELASEWTFGGKTAQITWSVPEGVNNIEVQNGYTCHVIPSSLNPQVTINATFKFNGEETTTFFNFTVSEKMEHLQEVNYWYTNTGVSITMKGYVVEIATAYSATYNNVSFYMVDENLDAGYYIYRGGITASEAEKLVPGAYVTVEGTTNTVYNGLYETNAGGTVTVDSTKTIDLSTTVYANLENDLLSGSPAAVYNQSRLVKLEGWEVVSYNTTGPKEGSNSTLFTLQRGDAKVAVATSKYLEGAYAAKSTDPTYTALVEVYNQVAKVLGKENNTDKLYVTVQGIFGNYKGDQIMPLTAADLVLVEAPSQENTVAPSVKTAIETLQAKFDLPQVITSATTIEIPAEIAGVKVEGELLGEKSSFAYNSEEGKLVITPDAEEVATFQLTLTVGDYTTYLFMVMRAEDLDDLGKAEWELQNFAEIDPILADGTYTLSAPKFFDNAKVVWTTTAPYATINGTELTVSLPLEESRLELVATVTVGTQSAEAKFFVKVSAMPTQKPVFVEGLQAGSYKLGLYQGNLGKYLYLTGAMSDGSDIGFLATTEDYEAAPSFTIAEAEGGYTIKIGEKFLEAGKNDSGSYRAALVKESTGVWAYAEGDAVPTFTVDGDKYFLNAYNTFETAGASKISYLDGAFVVKMVTGLSTVKAQDILDTIVATTETTVSKDFVLNYKATWEVVSGTAITLDGLTAKVTAGNQAETVVLKATVNYGGETAEKEITFTVPIANPAPYDGYYKLSLVQPNLGKTLYAKAEIASDRYLATTENPMEAADLLITSVEGGYNLKLGGYYLAVGNNAAGKTAVLLNETAGNPWVWEASAKVMTYTFDSKIYYLGTYKTFDTISASETWRITGDNLGEIGTNQFVVEYTRPAPVDGTYVYGLYQAGLEKTLYATGTIASGKYLDTTDDIAQAAKFTVTKVDGGYTIKVGDKFVEIDITVSGTKVSGAIVLVDTSTAVWTWNDQAGVMVFSNNDASMYIGTYKQFATFSASKISYVTGENLGLVDDTQYIARFYVYEETTTCDHVWNDGEVTTAATCTVDGVKTYTCTLCNETKTEVIKATGHKDEDNNGICDVCGTDLNAAPTYEKKTLAEFLALEDDYTKFYQIEGTIVEITNTTYGNVYISDGTTVVYLYGLASEKMAVEGTSVTNPKDFSTLGLEVGMHIVTVSAKASYKNSPQAVASGLLEKKAAQDLDKAIVAQYQSVAPAKSVMADFTLPTTTETGVTITWTSNSAAIVVTDGTAKVTQQATDTTVTLTATFTCGTFTGSNITATYTVVVEAAGSPVLASVAKLTFPDENSANNSANNYTSTWTAKIGNQEWTMVNFNNYQWNGWTYVRCVKKSQSGTASITTTMAQAVKQIKIAGEVRATAVSSVVLTVKSGDTVVSTQTLTEITGELVFDDIVSQANCTYEIVFNYDSQSSNGAYQVNSVDYLGVAA